jgi:hypothetical protein
MQSIQVTKTPMMPPFRAVNEYKRTWTYQILRFSWIALPGYSGGAFLAVCTEIRSTGSGPNSNYSSCTRTDPVDSEESRISNMVHPLDDLPGWIRTSWIASALFPKSSLTLLPMLQCYIENYVRSSIAGKESLEWTNVAYVWYHLSM